MQAERQPDGREQRNRCDPEPSHPSLEDLPGFVDACHWPSQLGGQPDDARHEVGVRGQLIGPVVEVVLEAGAHVAAGDQAVGVERQLGSARRAHRPRRAGRQQTAQVLDLLDGRRHTRARDADDELHTQRVVEQALLLELKRQAHVAGVEQLELGRGAGLAERLGHAAQERQVALEHAVAEVDRAAVEAGQLGLETQQLIALVPLGAPVGGAGREVEDRLAAALADPVDEVLVGVRVLGGRAVGLARVEVDDCSAGAPGGVGLVRYGVGRDREVRPLLRVGRLRTGDGALDDDGLHGSGRVFAGAAWPWRAGPVSGGDGHPSPGPRL